MSWLIIVFVILTAFPIVLLIQTISASFFSAEIEKTIGSRLNIIPPGIQFVPVRALMQPGSGGYLCRVYKKALPPDHYSLSSFLKQECSNGRPII